MSETFILGNNFNQFYNNNIKEDVAFLLERKYCYNNSDTRDGTSISNYNYLQADFDIPIKKQYDGEFIEPDTTLKQLVNLLTDNFLSNLQPLTSETELLESRISSNKNFIELKNEKNKNINRLNQELNTLNNNNYRNKRNYQDSHFSLNYYKFLQNLIINSILFLTIMFCIFYLSQNDYSLLSPNTGFYLNIVIITIFAVYFLLNLNTIKLRNRSNWNQIRFKTMSNTADTV